MSKNKIVWQRCFKIPKKSLDLFLVKINMSDSSVSHYNVEYIFENDSLYDVVVNEYGHNYPYMENEIEDFAQSLAKP